MTTGSAPLAAAELGERHDAAGSAAPTSGRRWRRALLSPLGVISVLGCVLLVVTAIVATLVLAPRNDADPTKRWDLLSSILALVALEGLVVGVKELVKVEGSGWTVLSFDGHIALFVVALTFTGMGVSAAIAVASSAIIGNVPVSRAGMASSIEEVSYEFGSLAAVALLGSLVSFCVHLPHRATERH
jgi:hypothetical protein